MAFSFLSYFGGQLDPGTDYFIDEQDLLIAAGVNPATSSFDSVVKFTYGLNPVALTVSSGTAPNRTYTFNLGTLNYREFIQFRYNVLDGDNNDIVVRSDKTTERAVDDSSLPPNPNISPPIRTGQFNLLSYLGGSISTATPYAIQESDLLAPFNDPDGDTLAVSTRDGSTAGLPVVAGGDITVIAGTVPNRTFELITYQEGEIGFLYTVSDYLSNYVNNYYTATNGRQP